MEIQLWKELLDPYEQAVSELVNKFRNIKYEHQKKNLYSPIESVDGRVKSVSSILDKMQRKGITFNELEEVIEDIAGVRIITQFVEDIYVVAHLIDERTDMRIIQEKDYLKKHKQSGYRSLHLIILYTIQTLDGPKEIQAEIQIRTMAMDFWATTEHSLQYKYRGDIPDRVAERLQRTSDAIVLLDQEMSRVRSEIMDAQIDRRIETNLIQDILHNIENLYRMENKREIIKIQTEFYRIYSMKDIDELRRFSKQLDILAEGARAQSVDSERYDS